jgi:hypothetical protein
MTDVHSPIYLPLFVFIIDTGDVFCEVSSETEEEFKRSAVSIRKDLFYSFAFSKSRPLGYLIVIYVTFLPEIREIVC